MSMLFYMYGEFLLLALFLIILICGTWWCKKHSILTRLQATFLVTVAAFSAIVWLFIQYQPTNPSVNYTLQSASIPDLAPLAQKQNRYIGSTFNGDTSIDVFSSHFNSATLPNELKWAQLLVDGQLGEYDFTRADTLVDQLLSAGVAVRGHNLIWGKWSGVTIQTYPLALKSSVKNSAHPEKLLKQLMQQHISAVVTHYRGRIERWDVVNEPLLMSNRGVDENFFYQVLGNDYIVEAFRYARQASAEATLFLNEDFRSFSPDKTSVFLDLLNVLLERGAPIDAIGIQSHHLYDLKNLEHMSGFLDKLDQLGLKYEFTELDVPLWFFKDQADPYLAQAEYFRDYAQLCYQRKGCIGVTTWGVHDAETWLDWVFPFSLRSPNKPLLLDAQLQKKPAYQGLITALKAAN